MDFIIKGDELAALCGLPHIQQLTYLRGIRPYMDVKTSITGIKRRVSYQSISEQLYIEPHQGIKSQSFSRDQIRRAVSGLRRAEIIEVQSEGKQLILKCLLASQYFPVQNKAAINPPQKATIKPQVKTLINTGLIDYEELKGDTAEQLKAAIPLKEDNNIYLLQRFDHFWHLYPEKKSREQAFENFKQINPDENLLCEIIQALQNQIKATTEKEAHGQWVPAWKYPANWLSQKCWQDEVKTEVPKEKRNAKHRSNGKATTADPFWSPESQDSTNIVEESFEQSNVVSLQCYRKQ